MWFDDNPFNLCRTVPFLAALSTKPPLQRPLLTRLIEQGTVGVIAAVAAVYQMADRNSLNITRLTAAIVEVHAATRDIDDDVRELRQLLARKASPAEIAKQLAAPRSPRKIRPAPIVPTP